MTGFVNQTKYLWAYVSYILLVRRKTLIAWDKTTLCLSSSVIRLFRDIRTLMQHTFQYICPWAVFLWDP